MAATPSRPAGSTFGSSILDAPPPNPTLPGLDALQPTGTSGGLSATPPSRALAPEILMGYMKSIDVMSQMLDDLATGVPDVAADFAATKDMLLRAAGKLVLAGGAPSGAGDLGRSFPGSSPSSGEGVGGF